MMHHTRLAGAAIAAGVPRSAPAGATSLSPWRVSWPLLVGLLLFALLLNTTGLPLLADPDSHWHLAVGRWILANGWVPAVDSHSHTFVGQPWIAKEWLSQLLLALAESAGGWAGVAALCAAAIGLSFALLLRLLLIDIRPLPAMMFTLAAIVLTAPHLLARPHVLAFPVMLLWVAGLVRAVEQRHAPRPLLLLAMLLWANLHGGFTLGLMLCGVFAFEAVVTARDATESRSLFIGWLRFGIAALLVACITPYGPESILVTFRIFGLGDVLGMISEWKSPDFQAQPMQELILLVAVFAALTFGLKLPLLRLVLVLGLLHLFLKHARNAELLAMLAPLALAPLLARQWPSLRPDGAALRGHGLGGRLAALARPAGRYGTLACLSLAALFAAGMIRFGEIRPPANTTPIAALDFARQAGLRGQVFNDYDFGGYLIHAGVPTFIDGRGELFGGDFIRRYADAVTLRGDERLGDFLDRHAIDWTLLRRDQAANRLLEQMPGWRLAFSDDVATVFVRQRVAASQSQQGNMTHEQR
jgi:hypothetical protein